VFTLESIRVALSNLSRRKLRSFLTMLGIIFGVGAVIAMLSIGAGAERESLRIIENFGIRNIIIQAKDFKPEELKQVRTESLGLTLRDARALDAVVQPRPLISPKRVVKTFQVVSEKGRADSRILGVGSNYPEIQKLKLLQGAFFMPFDEDAANQVCVLGITAKQKLFGFGDVLGQRIKINDQWFTVIGVLADANLEKQEFEGVKIQNPNNDIYVPITTALKKFETNTLENELNEVVVQVADKADLKEQAAAITNLMSTMHRYVDDYSLIVPEKLLEQNQKTQRIFNIVMGAIASISLVVGGIGIMNIMLASVLERTTEIGLRRAIGARRRDIRLQFIAEALVLSLSGGILGIAIGFAISRLVAAYSGWSTIITVGSIALSFGVSSLVGLVFGIYPAVQASNVDPIECLRYE
jgi:putative ABC transport system permease protein